MAVNFRGEFTFMENIEIWKDVVNYEGLYKVSDFGNVKSVERTVKVKDKFNPFKYRIVKERVLKKGIDNNGYCIIGLCKNGTKKTRTIHQLVAESFLNHAPNGYKLVVNHINFKYSDNRLSNLEIITQRENANKKHCKSTSKYVGVHWHKVANKWSSRIVLNGSRIHLGYFKNEYEAHLAYENKLKTLL